MKIVRENAIGRKIEIELTDEEIREAFYEHEFKVLKQEILDVADSKGFSLPKDFPFEDVALEVKHLRSKDESYMEGYWDDISTAIFEELERMERK